MLGKVRGNLTASDRVDIRSDGSLTGDVVAARISIEDGAFFKGGIDIRKAGASRKAEAKTDSKKKRYRASSSATESADCGESVEPRSVVACTIVPELRALLAVGQPVGMISENDFRETGLF